MWRGRWMRGCLYLLLSLLCCCSGFSRPVAVMALSGAQPENVLEAELVQWIARVSIASDGTPGNGASKEPTISGDGRYVAFSSTADNLVSEDTNECSDVFVHDLRTRETVRVSVGTGGVEANSSSSDPHISGDGRYVTFASSADNLVISDTNEAQDIFVHDLETGQTTRLSVNSAGEEGNNSSHTSSISADGRYVILVSSATNLIFNATNSYETDVNGPYADIFLHDRQTGETYLVSLTSDGQQADGVSGDNGRPGISKDGRFIVFNSWADNLAGENSGEISLDRVYVRDREHGETSIVSIASPDSYITSFSWYPSISADGSSVAFLSEMNQMVSGEQNLCQGFSGQPCPHVYVRNLVSGELVRVSVNSQGAQARDGYSQEPQISADGNYVVYASVATNLVLNDTNNFCNNDGERHLNYSCYDIFLHDLTTSETFRVSVTPDGREGNENSYSPTVSAQGRYIAFVSKADNFVENDTNDVADVFVVGVPGSEPPAPVETNQDCTPTPTLEPTPTPIVVIAPSGTSTPETTPPGAQENETDTGVFSALLQRPFLIFVLVLGICGLLSLIGVY